MPDSEFNVLYDDLDSFIGIMPPDIRTVLEQEGVKDELIEVVMDLGRLPEAWLTQGRRRVLREEAVTSEELLQVSAHWRLSGTITGPESSGRYTVFRHYATEVGRS